MANWKKRRYADMEREMNLESAQSDPDYASYRPNMSRDELVKALDFHNKNSTQAKLPTKPGLIEEIRRWVKKPNESQLKKARVHDLIGMLYQALDAKPRRRITVERYRRFDLSFDYKGDFPAPLYREGMPTDELQAMLEIYPDPKISVPQLKAWLKKDGAKVTGGKQELLLRMRKQLGCADSESRLSYTLVSGWEDQRASLQAKVDEERRQWQAQVESNKENSNHLKTAQAQRKALQEKQSVAREKQSIAREKQKLAASTRPWCAKPYNPKSKPRAAFEADWKKAHPRLSFPYSGATLPTPEDFSKVLTDYETDKQRNAHHLLAYLLLGYGEFTSGPCGSSDHKYMSKGALKTIHGRQCTGIGPSHHYAVETLRSEVGMYADFRFQNGL
jgi:hypothetical protein